MEDTFLYQIVSSPSRAPSSIRDFMGDKQSQELKHQESTVIVIASVNLASNSKHYSSKLVNTMVQRAAASYIESGSLVAYQNHSDASTSSTNAETFLAMARERALRSFAITSQDHHDPVAIHEIPYLLRATRALIAMNSSIWDRCQDYQSSTLDGILPFSRVSVPRVKIRVDPTNTTTMTFQIETTVASMDFGSPPRVPRELSDLISVPMMLRTMDNRPCEFPDYATFLDRATLLRDEALVPFLVTLKDHLESVHLFLGTIEAWIIEPISQVHFLEDAFDGVSNVEIPEISDLLVPCGDNGGDSRCCTFLHPASSICLRCDKPYSAHSRGMSRHGVITHLCDYYGRNVGSFIKPMDKTIELTTYCQPCNSSRDDPAMSEELSMDSPADLVKLKKILEVAQHHRLDGSSDTSDESHEMMDDLSENTIEPTVMASVVTIAPVASEVYGKLLPFMVG